MTYTKIVITVLVLILILVNIIKKTEGFNQNNIILITQFYKPKWDLRLSLIHI